MQIVHLSSDRKRPFRIGVDIGQYHFVTADGYREEWVTMTAREWWKKQLWLKDGGYNQDSHTLIVALILIKIGLNVLNINNPPVSCQLLGGQWNPWNGWE